MEMPVISDLQPEEHNGAALETGFAYKLTPVTAIPNATMTERLKKDLTIFPLPQIQKKTKATEEKATNRIRAPRARKLSHLPVGSIPTGINKELLSNINPALVDSGATHDAIPIELEDLAVKGTKQKLEKPRVFKTANGNINIDHTIDFIIDKIKSKRALLFPKGALHCPILSVSQRNAAGYVYIQASEYACLYNPITDDYIACEPKGQGAHKTWHLSRYGGVQPENLDKIHSILQSILRKKERESLQIWRQHYKRLHQPHDPECDTCGLTHHSTKPAKRIGDQVERPWTKDGRVIAVDFIKYNEDISGNKWGHIGMDVETGMGSVALQKRKSDKDTLIGLQEIVRAQEVVHRGQGKPLIHIHKDDDSSYKGVVEAWIRQERLRDTNTGGYRPQMNPVERRIRKLKNGMRAALLTATGGVDYYAELGGAAMKHSMNIINHLPERGDRSPMEKAGHPKPDIDTKFNVFGALAKYPLRPNEKDQDYDRVQGLGIYVGESEAVPGGKVIIPITWNAKKHRFDLHQPIERLGTKIDDDRLPLRTAPRKGSDPAEFDKYIDAIAHDAVDKLVYEVETILDKRQVDGHTEYKVKWQGYGRRQATWEPEYNLTNYGAAQMIKDFEMKFADAALVIAMFSNGELGQEDAKIGVQRILKQKNLPGSETEWIKAWHAEEEQMLNQTLEEVTCEEERRNILKQKNVTPLRMNPEYTAPCPDKPDGKIKFRWITMGHLEPFEWTDGRTDAPTIASATLRLMIASIRLGETLAKFDVSGAFNQGNDYPAAVPPRHVKFRAHPKAPWRVFRARKPGYGGRGAGRNWYVTFDQWITGTDEGCPGFKRVKNDPATYYKGSTRVTLGIHVDDGLVKGERKHIQEFLQLLYKRFKMRDEPTWLKEGAPLQFLGMEIAQTTIDGKIVTSISQTDDIRKFLDDNDIHPGRPVMSPVCNKEDLYTDQTLVTGEEAKWYSSTFGMLQYFCTKTRFDIALTLSRLGTYLQHPTISAIQGMKRLLQYLRTTQDRKLEAWADKEDEPALMEYYVDSDHAGDRKGGPQSRTGIMFTMNNMPIHWVTRKQPITSTNSASAEIHAAGDAVKDANLMQWVQEEIGLIVKWPYDLHIDNTSCISFQKNTCNSTKIKGVFDLREAWITELRDEAKVRAIKISTLDNKSDLLTKVHSHAEFCRIMRDNFAQASMGAISKKKQST